MKLLQKLVTDDLKIREIEDGLEKLERRIPLTPLSLRLLVRLVEEGNEIPASLAELYQQFTDLALGRYDRKKGIAVVFEYEVKKRFLAELAFRLFVEQDTLVVTMQQFEGFLDEYSTRYNWAADQVPAFVDELKRSCVLEFEPHVAFAQRSFLEFFAGYYLYEHRDEIEGLSKTAVQHYYQDIWGDVVFFYVGLRRELPAELLEALLEHVSADEGEERMLSHAVGKFMIGRLLQAAWHSESRIKSMGIEGCVDSLPDVRHRLSQRLEGSMGSGWADLILLLLSRESFGSALLAKEAIVILEDLVSPDSESPHRLAKAVVLLAGIVAHVIPEDRPALVEALHTQISSEVMDTVEKARLMLMLRIPARSLEGATKAIKRRLKRMRRRTPKVFEGILPKQRKRGRKP